MLWNESLVMIDKETRSLWSHLMGKALKGDMEGLVLKPLPCTMLTWVKWRELHPDTTVLDMSPTASEFTTEFYREPEKFVLGWRTSSGDFHIGLDKLLQQTVIHPPDQTETVATFDLGSTAANLFQAKLDSQSLTFAAAEPGTMRDLETSSVWNITTGKAIEGEMKGRELAPLVGIMSYAEAWETFHPESVEVTLPADTTPQTDR